MDKFYTNIKERIENLSDDKLLYEGITRLSDYKDEVKILYQDEILKRKIPNDIQERFKKQKNTDNLIEKNHIDLEKKIETKEIVVPNMSEDEILTAFFEKNNLSEFIEVFKREKVFEKEILKELTDSDLEKLGFSILGERKKILKLFSNNEIEKFRNEILYKNLSTEERKKLDIPENKILKQNKFRYSGSSVFAESGILTLFENRIVWKGDVNSFIIPINKIVDVSIKNSAGTSVLKISDDVKVHDFYMVDRVSLGLAGAAMGGGGLGYMGLAMMNDKPMTDIEYWRVLIEKQREKETTYDGDRGNQIQESSGSGCITTIIVTIIIGIIIFFVVMMNSFPF